MIMELKYIIISFDFSIYNYYSTFENLIYFIPDSLVLFKDCKEIACW